MVTGISDLEMPMLRSAGGRETNIAPTERWLSLVGGSALTVYGLRRRSWISGAPLTLAGLALLYRGATGHSRMYERLGVSTAHPEETAIDVARAVTIRRSPDEVYRFWRDLQNLPRFMHHLRSVERRGENRYHWVAQPPATGRPIEWDSEIIEERPNELIRWRTVPDSPLYNAGTVSFRPAPGNRGTEVHVQLEYRPSTIPGLVLASVISPIGSQILKEEIRRFKQVMEAGEAPTVEGQPSARAA